MSRKPFSALRSEMSPEAQARATARTQEMLDAMDSAGEAAPQTEEPLAFWKEKEINAAHVALDKLGAPKTKWVPRHDRPDEDQEITIGLSERIAALRSSRTPPAAEAQIEMRVPLDIWGRLGIGVEAWVDLNQAKKDADTRRLKDSSGVLLRAGTLRVVMNVLQHCGEKHYVNPPRTPPAAEKEKP